MLESEKTNKERLKIIGEKSIGRRTNTQIIFSQIGYSV